MKVEKSKRNFWQPSEIECMLSLIKDVQDARGNTATTHYTFVQIANKMRTRGFPNKSPTQIRRKWFQMKSAYLCFKRGNVERLLLIPERFRSVIAEFVDAEYKSAKSQSAIVQNENSGIEYPSIPTPSHSKPKPIGAGITKNSYYQQRFAKFLARVKHTHKIINRDFKNMQEALMLYEQKWQSYRDSNLITFIKNNRFKI